VTTTAPGAAPEARPRAYRVYTAAWAAAGGVLLVFALPAAAQFPPGYLLFLGLALVGNLFFVPLWGGLRLSLQVTLAPVWLFGWQAAPPIFLLSAPVAMRSLRADRDRALLYFGNGTVWTSAAGALFQAVHPSWSPVPTWHDVASVLGSGLVFVVGNLATAAYGRALATGDRSLLQPGRFLATAATVFACYVPLAYLLVLTFQAGPAPHVLTVGVWLLTGLAMKGMVETREANERLQRTLRELGQLSLTDPLTGLSNRRHFMRVLPQELQRHSRTGQPLSVLVLDLRSLKWVNDRYGHAAGDEALRKVAEGFRSRLRGSDLAFRIGGDEFAVLLPATDTAGALRVAEDLVRILSCARLEEAPDARLEGSIGVATFPHHARDPDPLIAAADAALYRARELGVSVASAPAAEPA
jgi:diguanylate cyclase (GGDEF)-like protein